MAKNVVLEESVVFSTTGISRSSRGSQRALEPPKVRARLFGTDSPRTTFFANARCKRGRKAARSFVVARLELEPLAGNGPQVTALR